MTEDMEKIIKGVTGYTEPPKQPRPCRNCVHVVHTLGNWAFPRELSCFIGGKLGRFPVLADATCNLFEERK